MVGLLGPGSGRWKEVKSARKGVEKAAAADSYRGAEESWTCLWCSRSVWR